MQTGFLSLIVALLLAACTGPGSSPGGEQQAIPSLQGKDPAEAAQKSLDTYKRLVSAEDFAALGFQSLEEVQNAELGASFPIQIVPLDRLQQFDQGGDTEGLLTDAGRVVFEVQVDEALRSSIEVGRVGDLWQGQSFGEPALIGALAPLRQSEEDFEVVVPALNVYFVATRTDAGLQLTPAFDYPAFNLSAGRALPAAEALNALVDAAKNHNGLPN